MESIQTDGTIVGSILVGVTSGLSGGPNDLVLFANSAWANDAVGADWSSVFSSSSEPAIIADINSAYAGNAASGFIRTKVAGALIAPNGNFEAIAFSTGQIIGSGVSTVPKPATWVTMVAGFAALAWSARRRRAYALG